MSILKKNSTIPFFSLSRQCHDEKQAWISIIERILDTQFFVGGAHVEQFENTLSEYLNNAQVISCNSGTDALWMALAALDIKPDDIVLTTPFSFIASSSEIVAHHAIPLFIDIDPETFSISPEKMRLWLENECVKIQNKTIHRASHLPVKGIITVDIFGQLADYTAIKRIAQEWNLWIIEDACQSIGATDNNRKASSFGEIGTFSFYPTKNLGAFGDGGCMVTENQQLAEKLIRLKNHGRTRQYHYQELGRNSRLDGIQALFLTEKLKTLDERNQKRKEHAQHYFNGLHQISLLQLPKEKIGTHTFHQYSIMLKEQSSPEKRDKLIKLLAEKGIETRVFYPEPLNAIPFLQSNKIKNNECPIAQQTCNSIISLPIWPELRKNEIDFIIHGIVELVEKLDAPLVRVSANEQSL